jgi:hypothetical protein
MMREIPDDEETTRREGGARQWLRAKQATANKQETRSKKANMTVIVRSKC